VPSPPAAPAIGIPSRATRAKPAAPAAILDKVFITILLKLRNDNDVSFLFQKSLG
jgi:hypothetical protein